MMARMRPRISSLVAALLVVVGVGCPAAGPRSPGGPSLEPARLADAGAEAAEPEPSAAQASEPAIPPAPQGPPEPAEVAAYRAWAADHPEEVPATYDLTGSYLVILRRPEDALLCLVADPEDDDEEEEDGPAMEPTCWRTTASLDELRIFDDGERSAVAFAGGVLSITKEGAFKAASRVPRGRWSDARGVLAPAPRRVGSGPTLEPTPVEARPLAALVTLAPRPLEASDAAWRSDALLCLRVEGAWRCATPEGLGEGYPEPERVRAPLREGSRIVAPLEVSRCGGGSELSECVYQLELLEIAGDRWTLGAALPLGATIDEHTRERDDDDAGARVIGTTESFRWRYEVEAPGCVRFIELEREAEAYSYHFRDDRPDQGKRRPRTPSAALGPAPAELPRRVPPLDPYADPADLRGSWRVDGDRWLPAAACGARG